MTFFTRLHFYVSNILDRLPWTQAKEFATSEGNVEEHPLHISDLPVTALVEIFHQLPRSDKANLFHAASPKQTEKIRDAAFPQIASSLFPLVSDPEARHLYKLVFGKPLPSPELFQKRWEAERKMNAPAVHRLNTEIASEYRKLSDLKLESKWNDLPEEVKGVFGNIDSSQIFQSVQYFKSVLSAIRAHNLVCVGKALRLLKNNLVFETRELLVEVGEAVAKWLSKNGDTVTELLIERKKLTCLPLEVTNLKNLTDLVLGDNKLSSIPPQIGNLGKLKTLDIMFNHIASLPPEIEKCRKLEQIYLQVNRLTSLPNEIGNLPVLKWLDIRYNPFGSLPPLIEKLRKKAVQVLPSHS